MPQSFSTINPTNFELSPCRVTYKGADVGATLGNVKIAVADKLSELKADQLGSTAVDKKVSGHVFTAEWEFAEVQNKSNWQILFPCHKLVSQNGNTGFYFDSQIGYSQRSQAGLLNFHPLSKPDTDLSEDFTCYLAASESSS